MSTKIHSSQVETGTLPGTIPIIDSQGKIMVGEDIVATIADLTSAIDALNTSMSSRILTNCISTSIKQVPLPGEYVLLYVSPQAFWFNPSSQLSQAKSVTPASTEAIFIVANDGRMIGTITFEPGSTVGKFAGSEKEVFAPGDMLSIQAPIIPDDTLANISFALITTKDII